MYVVRSALKLHAQDTAGSHEVPVLSTIILRTSTFSYTAHCSCPCAALNKPGARSPLDLQIGTHTHTCTHARTNTRSEKGGPDAEAVESYLSKTRQGQEDRAQPAEPPETCLRTFCRHHEAEPVSAQQGHNISAQSMVHKFQCPIALSPSSHPHAPTQVRGHGPPQGARPCSGEVFF